MKSNVICNAMNTVNPTQAQKARMRAALEDRLPREEPPRREYRARHKPARRWAWLPAGAALLALVVLAGYFLASLLGGGTQLSFGKDTGLSGLYVSKEYRAHAEWDAYREEYDPDGSIFASDQNIFGELSEGYTIHGIFTMEMTDQFEKILEKYGMTNQWRGANVDSMEQLCATLGISSVLSSDPETGRLFEGGVYYPGGTFAFDAVTTLNQGWSYPVEYRFLYNRTGDFVAEFPGLAQEGDYTQWQYTTSGGAALTLALGAENALIYGQGEEGMVLVSVKNSWVESSLYADGGVSMGKEDLEAFTETFDFSLLSGKEEPAPTQTETPPPETDPKLYDQCLQKYADAIRENWDPERCSAEDISILVALGASRDRLGYVLRDLDGDGSSELLITDGTVIYDLYTLTEGGVSHVVTGWERNSYALCEDNVIRNTGSNGAASSLTAFLRLEDGELKNLVTVQFSAEVDPDNPWFRLDGTSDSPEPISEAEADSILASYPVQTLSVTPLPGADPSGTGETENTSAGTGEVPALYAQWLGKYVRAVAENWDLERCQQENISYLTAFLSSVDEIGYTLMDLDGNGVEELIVSDGSVIYDVYSWMEDGILPVLSGGERITYTLCQDNIIACRGSSGAARTYYTFYRFGDYVLTEEEAVSYDADQDPDNPWFYAYKASGEPKHIPEEKAKQIIDAYVPVEIEMRDIAAAAG